MIVSRARRFVFVHIPKTGGTALSLALEARAAADDILVGDTPKARARQGRLAGLTTRGRLWKHSTLADIDGLLAPGDLGSFFVVTLVRNPWDRMVSLYHWLRTRGFAHPAVGLARAHGFSGWLNHPRTQAMIAAAPASSYTRDAGGTDRATLCARLEEPGDLAPFEAHLGFRLTPLPHANAGDRPAGWRGVYTDADAELVARLCAEDVARFGYGFEDGASAGKGLPSRRV